MAERVYCPGFELDADGDATLEIHGDEARHLGRVRRAQVGAFVEVFDGRGVARQAEVIEVGSDYVSLRPIGAPLPDRRTSIELTLATAVPKGDRFDWLVEKAAELGVTTLVPLRTERSVVDPRDSKLDRLRRNVVESAKQCGRNRVMTIASPVSWDAFVRQVPRDLARFVAHPGGLSFPDWPRPVGTAIVAIGPEGGFTEAEIELAAEAGWVAVSLGATLLRIETAALVASARLLALAESFGPGGGSNR